MKSWKDQRLAPSYQVRSLGYSDSRYVLHLTAPHLGIRGRHQAVSGPWHDRGGHGGTRVCVSMHTTSAPHCLAAFQSATPHWRKGYDAALVTSVINVCSPRCGCPLGLLCLER